MYNITTHICLVWRQCQLRETLYPSAPRRLHGSLALSLLLGPRLISPLNSGAILALPHGENGPAALPLTPAPLRAHSLRLEPHVCLLLWLLSWKTVLGLSALFH
jgi:hypothetical protein